MKHLIIITILLFFASSCCGTNEVVRTQPEMSEEIVGVVPPKTPEIPDAPKVIETEEADTEIEVEELRSQIEDLKKQCTMYFRVIEDMCVKRNGWKQTCTTRKYGERF